MAENIGTPPPSTTGPGGFLPPHPGLPSPAPSGVLARSAAACGLPHPRGHALRPGSAKEDMVRRFVENRLLHINRRFVKKFGIPEPGDEVVGYGSLSELSKDLEGVIDVLWLSGTPSLQIPYLLNIAGSLTTWLPSFGPSPVATFRVLYKLDHCFASLLAGRDTDSGEPLPGFENGIRTGGMSRTDMVRCKSLVEQTRVLVAEVISSGPPEDEEEEEVGADDETPNWDEDEERLNMDVARAYENTLVLLGDTLVDKDAPPTAGL